MDESYAEIGTEVILGRHVDRIMGRNWCEEKNLYIGVKTKIIRTGMRDMSGCSTCHVECDGGRFNWRVESMILASDVPLLTPKQKAKMGIKDG